MTIKRIGVVLAWGMLCAGQANAAEPQAAFRLKSGWVEVTLRQDGRPVADGVIQVVDEKGRNFAEGQTGPDGDTAFPLPAGASFTVEIKASGETADPIRLYKIDDAIQPPRVLLSYGLRPCCRFKSRGEAAPSSAEAETPAPAEAAPPVWWIFVAMGVGLSLVAVVGFVVLRQGSKAADSLPRE